MQAEEREVRRPGIHPIEPSRRRPRELPAWPGARKAKIENNASVDFFTHEWRRADEEEETERERESEVSVGARSCGLLSRATSKYTYKLRVHGG